MPEEHLFGKKKMKKDLLWDLLRIWVPEGLRIWVLTFESEHAVTASGAPRQSLRPTPPPGRNGKHLRNAVSSAQNTPPSCCSVRYCVLRGTSAKSEVHAWFVLILKISEDCKWNPNTFKTYFFNFFLKIDLSIRFIWTRILNSHNSAWFRAFWIFRKIQKLYPLWVQRNHYPSPRKTYPEFASKQATNWLFFKISIWTSQILIFWDLIVRFIWIRILNSNNSA